VVARCFGAGLAICEVVLPLPTVAANVTLESPRFAFFPCSLEMRESIISHVLRKIGVISTGPKYSRLDESLDSSPSGYWKDGQWPRMFGKRHLAFAAFMSATLIVCLLVREIEVGECDCTDVGLAAPGSIVRFLSDDILLESQPTRSNSSFETRP
jgi:hypothetical protein